MPGAGGEWDTRRARRGPRLTSAGRRRVALAGQRGGSSAGLTPPPPAPGMSERERQVMKKLKEVVDKQRDEIRAKDRELGLKSEDVDAVSEGPLPHVRPF